MSLSGTPIQQDWPILRTRSIQSATPASEAAIERIFRRLSEQAGDTFKTIRLECSYSFEKDGRVVAQLLLWPWERILVGFGAEQRRASQAAQKLASKLRDQVRQHSLRKEKFYFVAAACGEEEDAIVASLQTFLKAT